MKPRSYYKYLYERYLKRQKQDYTVGYCHKEHPPTTTELREFMHSKGIDVSIIESTLKLK